MLFANSTMLSQAPSNHDRRDSRTVSRTRSSTFPLNSARTWFCLPIASLSYWAARATNSDALAFQLFSAFAISDVAFLVDRLQRLVGHARDALRGRRLGAVQLDDLRQDRLP